jgi:branched-chain amino acid transport system permease protein
MLPGGVRSFKYETDLAILRTKSQWLWLAVGLAWLFTFPLYAGDYWLSWLTRLGIVIVAVLGLHLLTGLCGQISIGHAAFVGLGAYMVGVLTTRYGLNWWLCLPLSGLAAGLAGVIFGLPSFRLKGFYLAVSTLAGHFIIMWLIGYYPRLTGGYSGMSVVPPTLLGIDFSHRAAMYCLVMAFMVLFTYFAKNIQRTTTGRVFVAVRDNELAAQVCGANLFGYKLLAFFIGCLFAGVAGWLWAASQWRLNPEQFRLDDSILWLGMLIIGGMGTTSGVFFGATFVKLFEALVDLVSPYVTEHLPHGVALQFPIYTSLIGLGLIIIAFLIFQPMGFHFLWEKLKVFYRLHPYSYQGR